MYLKRMCIQLFWDVMSCIYLLSPSGLMCHSKMKFPLKKSSFLTDVSAWIFHSCIDVSVMLKFSTITVLLSVFPFMSLNICFMYLDDTAVA